MYLVQEKRLKRMIDVLNKRQKDLILFVDDVKNEHNFSAIIRTCDAVGVLYLYYYYSLKKLDFRLFLHISLKIASILEA